MNSAGCFGNNNMNMGYGNGVDMYDKNGRAYSLAERVNIARKRCICVNCGVKTHEKTLVVLKWPAPVMPEKEDQAF